MRMFSCFVRERDVETPTLCFILAKSEDRARALARRELLDGRHRASVEICEAGKVLWREELAAA